MVKMTQRNAIAYVLENCELPTDVLEKVKEVKASLDKKSVAKGDRKPTATQLANETFKEVIVASMEADRLYTVTEIQKSFDFGTELSNQRVSALITQLKKTDVIERIEEKGKAYFRLK